MLNCKWVEMNWQKQDLKISSRWKHNEIEGLHKLSSNDSAGKEAEYI
jgi:hypothetical protein